ncbi:23S rRNA pseudouridine1911/1915/1917 synthase [Lachnospiraceae bacterium XPB1003]|nr:23S rRNA pseudouridine1911/1915/1917 synthase [Lachnospiraceae bacterium XPB1003]
MSISRFVISEEYENERADRISALLMPDCSRTYLQKLIKDGNIVLNGKTIKSSTKVVAGDELIFDLPEPVIPEIIPEEIPLNIVFENKDLIIINKPKDMVVHPAPGHLTGTVVNAVLHHCKDLSGINGIMRPGIVHRIDKDTSGLLIICKNDNAHRNIAEQLKIHSIERTYHAIVHGIFSEEFGTVNKPLGRSDKDRKKMAVVAEGFGKPAVTHYSVLKQYKDYAYIKCNLETGRTHQIRVHMASIGHPLVGDPVYGIHENRYKNTCGQVLHAKSIGFDAPDGSGRLQFDSELPEYFTKILNDLENSI